MMRIFSRKKRARYDSKVEIPTNPSASMSRSGNELLKPTSRKDLFMAKFAILAKRNQVGYAEERERSQRERLDNERREQLELWKRHLDYSESKEAMYKYQSASTLALNAHVGVEDTAESTAPTAASRSNDNVPRTTEHRESSIIQDTLAYYEARDREFRDAEAELNRRNREILARLPIEGYGSEHATIKLMSNGSIQVIESVKVVSTEQPISPQSEDKFSSTLIEKAKQAISPQSEDKLPSVPVEKAKQPISLQSEDKFSPAPVENAIVEQPQAKPITPNSLPDELLVKPAFNVLQKPLIPSQCSSKHSSSSSSAGNSILSVSIPSDVLRESREFLEEFFAKAVNLSEAPSVPPAPQASGIIVPIEQAPLFEEMIQGGPVDPKKTEIRQVCSAQDLAIIQQRQMAFSRCKSTDILFGSCSMPVSFVTSPLSPRTIRGERIRELVSRFENHGQ